MPSDFAQQQINYIYLYASCLSASMSVHYIIVRPKSICFVPKKKKHTHTHTQQQKQSARGKRRKTKDSSAQLALNGKQSTAMAKTTMEARSLVFFLLMAFCWMLGMFARKVVWFVCLFFFFFFLAFGRRYQAAPAGKRNPPKKQKTNTAVITKMTAKLHYGTAVASDGHVRRSSSAGDINVGNEGV